MIEVNKKNYYSDEVNKEYMSVSLFKSFIEEYGGCEAKAMATLKGEWKEPPNPAFLIGQYVHAWSEGKLEQFKEEHPEIISSRGATKGKLKKEFMVADKMIETLKKDKLVSKVREGEKEVIFTTELFGVPWKCQIDIDGENAIVDLKTTRDFRKHYFNEFTRCWDNFIEYYGYDIQMAIYAEIERICRNRGSYKMPHIIAVTKEEIPDKAIINMGTEFIEDTINWVSDKFERVKEVWQGREEPHRCEHCNYCKSTKQLREIIHYREL